MASTDDTEITLGVGKLLGLFFLLAAICGVFFSIGYSLGKSSGREQALNDQPAQASPAPEFNSGASASSENKPSAAVAMKSDGPAPAADDTTASNDPGKLTFYKAVQQSGSGADTSQETAPATPKPAAKAAAVPATAVSTSTTTTTVATSKTSTVLAHTSPVTGPGTLVVQIAAVSREDDAVSLAGALRKKNYNVFVVNNPVTNDKLYHVQVGPFATVAEAEAMKAKLVAEGYNPIIKK